MLFRVWIVYKVVYGELVTKQVWKKYYDVSKLMEARLLGINDFMKEVKEEKFIVESVEVDEEVRL